MHAYIQTDTMETQCFYLSSEILKMIPCVLECSFDAACEKLLYQLLRPSIPITPLPPPCISHAEVLTMSARRLQLYVELVQPKAVTSFLWPTFCFFFYCLPPSLSLWEENSSAKGAEENAGGSTVSSRPHVEDISARAFRRRSLREAGGEGSGGGGEAVGAEENLGQTASEPHLKWTRPTSQRPARGERTAGSANEAGPELEGGEGRGGAGVGGGRAGGSVSVT